MRRMMTPLGWGAKAHSWSALRSVPSIYSCDWQIRQTKKCQSLFPHKKSQSCCAVANGTLLIICNSHVFHYNREPVAPWRSDFFADIHCNNWNIQPVLMVLWGDIFVLRSTCIKFWWIPARVLMFFGDYPPVIDPLPFFVAPPGVQF